MGFVRTLGRWGEPFERMKRFTETQKWDDPWFRRLSPELKLLWQWLLDHCDNAGIIDPDLELASFQIGYPKGIHTLSDIGERVVKLPCGKYFIPKFIPFQYGTLSVDCRAHGPVFQSLEKHGLKGYPKGIHTLQEKEKDKDKDKRPEKSKGSREDLMGYAMEIQLPYTDGNFLFEHFEETGWKRGKEPIRDWKATMRKWKAGGWLPSQKIRLNGEKPKHNPTKGIQENIELI